MGNAARERILEQFTWKHHHIRLLHAYAYAKHRQAKTAAWRANSGTPVSVSA